jgi:hypothetical protein
MRITIILACALATAAHAGKAAGARLTEVMIG